MITLPRYASHLVLITVASSCSDPNSAAEATPVPQYSGTAVNQVLPGGDNALDDNALDDNAPAAVDNTSNGDGSQMSAPTTGVNEGQGESNLVDNGGSDNSSDLSGSATAPAQDAMGTGGSGMGDTNTPEMTGVGGGAMTPAVSDNAVPSAGCGQGPGNPGDLTIGNSLVFVPNGYDGSSPLPLVFGFHGAGRTNEDQRLVDSRTDNGVLEENYIVAYMKSAGNGWDLNTDRPRFEANRQEILSQLCVDTSHIFAFGHSSGAQFITQMLGTGDPEFAGVSVVASSRYGNPAWEPVPTLVIHGLNDNQRGGDADGAQDLTQYVESNGCTNQTQPHVAATCNSIDTGNPAVNAGCVEYMGCNASTVFCNHDDPNYSGTNHGWPCFANDEIFDFFQALR